MSRYDLAGYGNYTMPAASIRFDAWSNGSETPCCYKSRMNHVCNGLLGLSVLLWAVTAGERTYMRHHATQTTCTHEPTRFFSKYQYNDCLRRSTARTGRRATV
jgi:hypothetical protein